MISFQKFELPNGLKVIHHPDPDSSLVVLNVLYNVGARDEDPERTGFAHLFEHLMFGGSANIPNYDSELQKAGGENNAFTNNDITNYYLTLPANNAETGFWLESDRMLKLDFSQQSLDIQKGVVIEEFKQRYINQPYGDIWHKIRPVAYKEHPYAWPTIGKNLEHIENATLEQVEDFFYKFYNPSNAVLCIAGGISLDEAKRLSEKWFGPIPKGPVNSNKYPSEPKQLEKRIVEIEAAVPQDVLFLCFKMCDRLDPDYYASDILSDMLGNSESSYLYKNLVKDNPVFSQLHTYIMGSSDEGLLVISGSLLPTYDLKTAEGLVWETLNGFLMEGITEKVLERAINQVETSFSFSMLETLERAMGLCMAENLGDINIVNRTMEDYSSITLDQMKKVGREILNKNVSTALHYKSKENDNK